MKGGTVQINWHDTKPVLSLDFHPNSSLLASSGADFDIKVLTPSTPAFTLLLDSPLVPLELEG